MCSYTGVAGISSGKLKLNPIWHKQNEKPQYLPIGKSNYSNSLIMITDARANIWVGGVIS